jgi:aminoglycoside phosphotransferase (APT) family kinase protein
VPIQITAAEAQALLLERGHEATDLESLTGGLWSTTFAFKEAGREFVVRFHERRDDLEKDRFASRWASPALRVPHIVEIGDLATGAYGISARVGGGQIDDLDADGMRRILPSLFAAMDAMRDADLSGTSGWGLWHGDGNGTFPTWREMLLRNSKEGELVASYAVGLDGFDAGMGRLRELLAFGPERRYLVHDDLLYHNVFCDERGVIVLDWGASIYGDFLYDAALLTFWWPHYEQWRSIDIDALVREHFARGVPNFGERLRLCEMDIGLSHIPFQLVHRDASNAAWTARRTTERASAPL